MKNNQTAAKTKKTSWLDFLFLFLDIFLIETVVHHISYVLAKKL